MAAIRCQRVLGEGTQSSRFKRWDMRFTRQSHGLWSERFLMLCFIYICIQQRIKHVSIALVIHSFHFRSISLFTILKKLWAPKQDPLHPGSLPPKKVVFLSKNLYSYVHMSKAFIDYINVSKFLWNIRKRMAKSSRPPCWTSNKRFFKTELQLEGQSSSCWTSNKWLKRLVKYNRRGNHPAKNYRKGFFMYHLGFWPPAIYQAARSRLQRLSHPAGRRSSAQRGVSDISSALLENKYYLKWIDLPIWQHQHDSHASFKT